MPEHILVIGATGAVGVQFCNEALSQGHNLTLLVRNASKLPNNIRNDPRVKITEGQLNDEKVLRSVTGSGAGIFVSFAGPTHKPITDCIKLIFPLLIENKFKRAMVLGTASFTAPQDKGALKWEALIVLVKIIGGDAFQEFNGLGEFLTSQDGQDLAWTLFRVPNLGNGVAAPVSATYTGSGSDGLFLSRKSVVAWVFKEMGQGSEWIRKAPALSN
ncbi:hypothetical protein BCR34DRAFT_545776 [Clohesyomyces aquaticus]|uniref:NAD(P)-binding domain-containing protein n=1 Tax=Clohesyomyces aquaticus TaxID=1231657 RepID=A0A1Y1YWM4_9PLEO|nr:hypothetical protein BCR34DRAFT_545776 [Clohesyomyces aquaticus]